MPHTQPRIERERAGEDLLYMERIVLPTAWMRSSSQQQRLDRLYGRSAGMRSMVDLERHLGVDAIAPAVASIRSRLTASRGCARRELPEGENTYIACTVTAKLV